MGFFIGLLYVLFTLAAIIIILMVLFRPSEGGGLGGAFGGVGGESALGVKATQVIDKAIATVAIVFVCIAILLAWLSKDLRPDRNDAEPDAMAAPANPGDSTVATDDARPRLVIER